MAWKTYFGFLIILMVTETASQDLCKESPDVVEVCKTVVDVKRQLFIPINNTIGNGCQCTVQMIISSDEPSSTVETKFLNTNNECGFQVSAELDGVLDTLTCNDSLLTQELESGDKVIYRFTGRSSGDATVCLQIVPSNENSKINISCGDQITDTNTTLPTSASQTISSTSSLSSSPSSSQSATYSSSTIASASYTSPLLQQQTTATSISDDGIHSSAVPGSTTRKPTGNQPDISFIIILIGSCVGGLLIIILIILITWCVIYQRRKKRLEIKDALHCNETDRHSLEGIQVENELFILAYKDDEDGDKDESKHNGTDGDKEPVTDESKEFSIQECTLNSDDQLPDIVKPTENGVKRVNFDLSDPLEALPEESVTEFKTDTISLNDASDNAMGRIQL